MVFHPGSGLEDQLLGQVVAEERPDLEEAKNQLIVSNAKMRQELKDIEDQILYRLSSSEGNPVDDMELIKVLEASKMKAAEIQVGNCLPTHLTPPHTHLPPPSPASIYLHLLLTAAPLNLTPCLCPSLQAKVRIAEQTEKDIDLTRMEYIPVAVRTQILFFCVSDLANVDPMYQYSLEWFLNIFLSGIANSERAGSSGTLAQQAHSEMDGTLMGTFLWWSTPRSPRLCPFLHHTLMIPKKTSPPIPTLLRAAFLETLAVQGDAQTTLIAAGSLSGLG